MIFFQTIKQVKSRLKSLIFLMWLALQVMVEYSICNEFFLSARTRNFMPYLAGFLGMYCRNEQFLLNETNCSSTVTCTLGLKCFVKISTHIAHKSRIVAVYPFVSYKNAFLYHRISGLLMYERIFSNL